MADSDDILGAYLRHRIEAWLREDPSRSAAALARSAGVTPTHISTIRSQSRGVGMKTIRGLAVALGTTLADLESEAAEWARENPQARRPTRTAPTLDRIEGYAAAEAAARAIAPRIPDAAWARVRALLAWHGLAHVLLAREAWEHDEGDAWILTLELACPHGTPGEPDEVVARTWAPEVVVRAWLPLSRRLGAWREAA